MKKLTAEKELEIRFNEVDSMGIVWHGNYATYFEDGREEFGRKYNLGYLRMFAEGFYTPLVTLDFSFKNPLIYGNKAIIEVVYLPVEAAKICFNYKITSVESGKLISTGSSVQVFLDKDYKLMWNNPEFYIEWKRNNGIK